MQIFDYDGDEHLSRAELLLLLRSTVTGVRKLCGFPPVSINIFEQLVSHAFATTRSSATKKNTGMSYIELNSWVRINEDVKSFIAASSPAAIHSVKKRRRTVDVTQQQQGKRKPVNKNRLNQKEEERRMKTHAHSLQLAAKAHYNLCLQHLKSCRELRAMYKLMDSRDLNQVTLDDFTASLPSTLKPMAQDMFRAMTNGKYLHFEQLLHEVYPHMTHDEIQMLCAATRTVKRVRKLPPVKLTAEQTQEMFALFDMYNTDHSGHMSVQELTAALSATGVFTTDECREYFELADHHHHHSLSRADFVHFFHDSFVAEENAPLFQIHLDDLTPIDQIPHNHQHTLL
jgi:hypothetical protein